MPRKRTTDTEIPVSRGTAAAPRRQTVAKPRVKRTAVVEPVVEAAETSAVVIPAVSAAEPSRAEIALLAYSFWESRGCQGGSPEEDWIRAEQQLSARAAAANV